MASAAQFLRVTVGGRLYEIGPLQEESLVLEFQHLLEQATSLAPSTMKLFLSGSNKGVVRLDDASGLSLSKAGIKLGSKLMLSGSSAAELDSITHAHDLPGLAPLDHDLLRARERATATQTTATALPSGPYTFGRYQSWQQPGLSPPPSAALKLLHRLAADPGIVAVMRKHRWEVGLLSEMPPEGKVGVSAMCILGYNVNAGQEISLRVRTDDLRGFRRYDRIRETLCHELAHMVHSEHDGNFKALNSQLLKESAALDWTQGTGHTTAAAAAQSSESGSSFSGPHARLMAATAASSGRTLAQLSSHDPITGASAASAAAGGQIPGMGHVDPTTASAEAAMARLGTPQGAQPPDATVPRPQYSNAEASRPQSLDAEPHQQSFQSSGASARHCCDGALHGSSTGEAAVPDAATSMESGMPLATLSDASAQRDLSTEQETTPAAAAAADSGNVLDRPHAGKRPEGASALGMDTEAASRPVQAGPADEVPQVTPPTHNRQSTAECPTHDQPGAAAAPDANLSSHVTASRSIALPHTSAAGAAAIPGSVADHDDDPGAARYQRAERAAQDLVREAGGGNGARALATLATILQNILDHPNEDKYRHIRLSNPTFMTRAGRFRASMQLLEIAGFSAVAQELRWQRNDPGLVWLSLAALRSAQAA